jgi:hypothetical protein
LPLNRVLDELAMSLDNSPLPLPSNEEMRVQVLRGPRPMLSKHPAPCEECQRLADVYLAAIARNNDAASAMATFYRESWPDTWREEMKDFRAACQEALENFNRHRAEHGR